MAAEENIHRDWHLDLYNKRFGNHLPPIRREDVKGFLRRRPIWLTRNLPLDTIRKQAETMEFESHRFYQRAAEQATDTGIRKLLGDLAVAEGKHESLAAELSDRILTPGAKQEEDKTDRRMFVLQYVQPGLAGLMDGSVSTLAPLFAAAFATHHNWQRFLSGSPPRLARGSAWALPRRSRTTARSRGAARRCCAAAFAARYHGRRARPHPALSGAGLLGQRLLDRHRHFRFIVLIELWAIAFIRSRYMDTPFLQAVFQIVVGGLIILSTGILIGGA